MVCAFSDIFPPNSVPPIPHFMEFYYLSYTGHLFVLWPFEGPQTIVISKIFSPFPTPTKINFCLPGVDITHALHLCWKVWRMWTFLNWEDMEAQKGPRQIYSIIRNQSWIFSGWDLGWLWQRNSKIDFRLFSPTGADAQRSWTTGMTLNISPAC